MWARLPLLLLHPTSLQRDRCGENCSPWDSNLPCVQTLTQSSISSLSRHMTKASCVIPGYWVYSFYRNADWGRGGWEQTQAFVPWARAVVKAGFLSFLPSGKLVVSLTPTVSMNLSSGTRGRQIFTKSRKEENVWTVFQHFKIRVPLEKQMNKVVV